MDTAAMIRPAIFLAALLPVAMTGAACTRFPELDTTITPQMESAEYPELVPLGALRTMTGTDPQAGARETDAMQARADALRRRARALARTEVLSGRARARLAGAQGNGA